MDENQAAIKKGKRGGYRPNSGRKKGVADFKTKEIAAKVYEKMGEGETPLEIMQAVALRLWGLAQTALVNEDPEERARGIRLAKMSSDAAANAAPYMHAKFATIELTGKDGENLPTPPVLVVPALMTDPEAWSKAAGA